MPAICVLSSIYTYLLLYMSRMPLAFEDEKKEVVHNNPEGSEVLLRKEDREEEFYFAPTKGKKSKAKKSGEVSTKVSSRALP